MNKENRKLDKRRPYCTVSALATLIECMYSGVLCLRVLGNWRSLNQGSENTTILHNIHRKLFLIPARSLQRSETLTSQLAGELLSHNLTKICKLNSKKFAQISLRATLFLPGKAIGQKIRPAMMRGTGWWPSWILSRRHWVQGCCMTS